MAKLDKVKNPAAAVTQATANRLDALTGSGSTVPREKEEERRRALERMKKQAAAAKKNKVFLGRVKEPRSERIQLLVKLSTLTELKAIVESTGFSMNEICNVAIDQFLESYRNGNEGN